MKLNKEQINSITSYFQDKPVKRAYIFGSYARGDADEKSDLDLMVELDYSKKIGLGFFRMQDDLESLMNTRVDVVTADSLSKYIKPYVEGEKVLIYEE